jgi:hypothetical protein
MQGDGTDRDPIGVCQPLGVFHSLSAREIVGGELGHVSDLAAVSMLII